MELFGSHTSPYVRHCRIAMLEAQAALGEQAQSWRFTVVGRNASDHATPTLQVPYLRDGERLLTDSTPILMHLRAQTKRAFLPDVDDAQVYFLATTILDATINRFLMAMDGLGPEQSPYLARQDQRIQAGLTALEALKLPELSGVPSDGQLRLACLLAWALFRERFSLDEFPGLQSFLASFADDAHFEATRPFSA